MNERFPSTREAGVARLAWRGLAVWLATWAALLALDGSVDLANLAMLLVLGSAIAAVWLPAWASLLASGVAIVAFNWTFVPPRHTFSIDLRQHALLLAAMAVVNVLIAALVIGQRHHAESARRLARREQRLRTWGDTLRDAADPALHAGSLCEALQQACDVPVALALADGTAAAAAGATAATARLDPVVGDADESQRAGLALCLREGRALGAGSGRYEEQPDIYLPLRSRSGTAGAVLLAGLGACRPEADLLAHAQALCDQFGSALERARALRDERHSRDQARDQAVRNALLAAISHDYRTPLATILGAASSLREQDERLGREQRQRLAGSIVDEVERLSRLTENTLQLARLDRPGVELRCDWESAEEIVGAVLARLRRRGQAARVRARLEPGLPLLWCDAMLVSQLLENLVDNALKYSPAEAPVEILVRAVGERMLLAVRDRGPGIEPAWRERVFDVFRRGAATPLSKGMEGGRGAGVGLAVCRAIARAHGGELSLRPRSHGGCSFECRLPLRAPPVAPSEGGDGP